MCLPWQHWTKALVWFDDIAISAFHSCVVVDLWQSLFEWHLILSACVLVCRLEYVGAWIRVTICQDLLERQDDVLGHVITGEETWVYQYDPETKWYDPETKWQSAKRKIANSPRSKNSTNPNQESKQCCWLFLILEGLFIMNLHQLDKQSTKFTIWKYWKGCVRKLYGNDPNFLPTTHGSCIMTMHLLTWHYLWRSF